MHSQTIDSFQVPNVVVTSRVRSTREVNNMTHVCLCVCSQGGTYLARGDTYLGWGVPTLAGGYLLWLGGTYLSWGGTYLGGTYLGHGGTYSGQGYLPWPGIPTPSAKVGPPTPGRQSSTANTCYTADGMPLTFTQEDFLVLMF